MSWLGNIVDKAANVVGIPKIIKTSDPRYNEAKETFKLLSVDTEQIIGSLIQMQTQIQQLAKASVKFGEDINLWFSDSPRETKLAATTVDSFAKEFDQLTLNYLKPRIDPNVVAPLAIFQKEVLRLQTVKEKRKKARKEFDSSRAKLVLSIEKKENAQKITEFENENKKNKSKYEELNEDFIFSISKLQEQRPEILEKPFRNLVAILSQYLYQVFNQMQKFRTTFPPSTFNIQNNNQTSFQQIDPSMISNPYEGLSN